jgi:hypothetical protein
MVDVPAELRTENLQNINLWSYFIVEYEIGRACSTNGGPSGMHVKNIGGKARRKDTTRKTKT